MKKSLIILFLLLIPLASAVETSISKSPPIYNKGETLNAVISGNFVSPILPENIYFYRGFTRVPFLYDVAKINDEYHIYALLSETQATPLANYSLIIKDVRYYKGSQIVDDDIQLNFSISEQTADFSSNPGFIISESSDGFSVKIQNLKDNSIDVTYSTLSNSSESINLKSGEIKKINFNTEDIKTSTFKTINLDSTNTHYEIPVFIFANKTEEQNYKNNQTIIIIGDLRFNPLDMNFSTFTKNKDTKFIYLYNTGQNKIENINLYLSDDIEPYISLSTYNVDVLDEGSEIKIEFYSQYENDEDFYVEGYVNAQTENNSIQLPVYVNFVKDFIPTNESYGTFTNQTNSNVSVTPPKEDDSSSLTDFISGKVIGWTIIIILILVVLWFYLTKYKKAEKKVDLLEVGGRRRGRGITSLPLPKDED